MSSRQLRKVSSARYSKELADDLEAKILARRRSLKPKALKPRSNSTDVAGNDGSVRRDLPATRGTGEIRRRKTVSGAGLAAAREARLRQRKESEMESTMTKWGQRTVLASIVETSNLVSGAAVADPRQVAAKLRREQTEKDKEVTKVQKGELKKVALEHKLKQKFWLMHMVHVRRLTILMDAHMWHNGAISVQRIFRSWHARAKTARLVTDMQEVDKMRTSSACWPLRFMLRCARRRIAAKICRKFMGVYVNCFRHMLVSMQWFKMKCETVQRFLLGCLACRQARKRALDLMWLKVGLETIARLERSYRDDPAALKKGQRDKSSPQHKMANKFSAKYSQLDQTLASSEKLNQQQQKMIAQNHLGAAELAKANRAERILISCAKAQDKFLNAHFTKRRLSHMKLPEVGTRSRGSTTTRTIMRL
jgi:hypothetical protein